jgi:hypothetical protein
MGGELDGAAYIGLTAALQGTKKQRQTLDKTGTFQAPNSV